MKFIDSNNKLNDFLNSEKKTIEIGCGNIRVFENSLTLDIIEGENVDIVCDIENGLPFIPDNSIDVVYSSHVLEHLTKFEFCMAEISRVLKKGGMQICKVPHFTNPYFYSDYTHKRTFGIYSFSYFSNTPYFKRGVPKYNSIHFKIKKVKIVFYSHYWVLNVFNKLFQFLFNSCRFTQEFYEAYFFKFISAYEIRFELEKE
ncbi:MAG: hypothetical protein A2W91_11660 [Bacteroidetes bacterium GWF2_38_335]|nr:MAG: hypothetical protein A2W91_11660 [Bacteroidetes bacterium GWF2_38_335]OFY77980.1 MAG: hypothetical protein A2281_18405 [Bacteroidetes bacterium RIFOXYA12_FULL_38_20]